MSRVIQRSRRFAWRTTNNLICTTATGRRWRYSASTLARDFGPDDAAYTWAVFVRHAERLRELGFPFRARRVLEVGPGRNLGSAVVWWAANGGGDVHVTLWDVFANMTVDSEAIRKAADALLAHASEHEAEWPDVCRLLRTVAAGDAEPDVDYVVCDQATFAARGEAAFDLILSHSALEHIWSPEETLSMLAGLTSDEGWQSMQIDLMDHGSRETNFVEMLEWSDLTYWLTTRFIPGGLNRWRAQEFIDLYEKLGLVIVTADRRIQKELPTLRRHLGRRFRAMSDEELLTSELFLVAQAAARP